MQKFDTIYLIIENPTEHGIFDKPTETKELRYCEVKSVGMNENYRLLDNRLKAEFTFVLSAEDEYIPNCKIVEYHNTRYQITRTAVDGTGKIRLICSSDIRDRGD